MKKYNKIFYCPVDDSNLFLVNACSVKHCKNIIRHKLFPLKLYPYLIILEGKVIDLPLILDSFQVKHAKFSKLKRKSGSILNLINNR